MSRKIYFGAGPAALPQPVLDQMARAILDYEGSGISILSIGHREPAFAAIVEEANAHVLNLAGLNADEYEVVWLQGGGRHQFAMLPMNFLGEDMRAGYIDSGFWAHDAMKAATYYGDAVSLSSSATDEYRHLPEWPRDIPDDLQYLHITTNNTIYGTQWQHIPDCPVPLVADMSSDIFSGERDYSRFSLIYAVAQKNLGPAGVTLVIIRREMLEKTARTLPDALSYTAQALANSMLNTPPVVAIYGCLLMLRWMSEQGIERIISDNRQKADILYAEIDRNSLFESPVREDSRSMMNVVYRMKDRSQEKAFLDYCTVYGIEGIKGHRSVGGLRASLYNAVSLEDVEALLRAMQTFKPADAERS